MARSHLSQRENEALLNAVTGDYNLESDTDPVGPHGSGHAYGPVIKHAGKKQGGRGDIGSWLGSPGKTGLLHEDGGRTYYEVFFVVLFVFSGYGCLFSLQRTIKEHLDIPDNGSTESTVFGVAVSSLYIGNLVFRLGHNGFFYFLSPRKRVLVSIVGMFFSMALAVLVLLLPPSKISIPIVFAAYFLGGLGIGTFESNVLSSIAPLGKRTKLVAIVAIPVGITCITIGGFLLMDIGVPSFAIFLSVSVGCVVSAVCWLARIYRHAGEGNFLSLPEFIHQLRAFREWLPVVWKHSLALTLDMFCVSLFSPGVILYIYDQKTLHFPWLHVTLQTNVVLALYNACFFLGDFSSRRIFFPLRTIPPFFFWGFSLIGMACGLSNFPELVFLCAFFVAFANGSIYAQANKKIDTGLDAHHSVVAFSFWLFLGDIGSVVGSNLISLVSDDFKRLYHH